MGLPTTCLQALASSLLCCLVLHAYRWLTWERKLNLKSWKWLSIWQVSILVAFASGSGVCWVVVVVVLPTAISGSVLLRISYLHPPPLLPSPALPSLPSSPLPSLRCTSHHFHSYIVSCPRIMETIKVTFLYLSITQTLITMELYIELSLFFIFVLIANQCKDHNYYVLNTGALALCQFHGNKWRCHIQQDRMGSKNSVLSQGELQSYEAWHSTLLIKSARDSPLC